MLKLRGAKANNRIGNDGPDWDDNVMNRLGGNKHLEIVKWNNQGKD
jgi:hypothetical protein